MNVSITEVEVEKVVKATEKRVILELTEEEAGTLCSVVGKIAGDPNTTRRRHTEALWRAMNVAGFAPWDYFNSDDLTGTLYFQ